MSLIDDLDRARQLASFIVSDLTISHKDRITEGIENDTLFELLAKELAEGRDLFRSRVTPEVFAQNIYDRALVDVLVKSKAGVKSKIW